VFAHDPIELLDAFDLDQGDVPLLAGGAPCQPFSKSSYWLNGDSRRLNDPRSRTLQAYLDIAEAALPDVLLLENVRGLSYRGKDEGLALLKQGLKRINERYATLYDLQVLYINAADYGVPQVRERVFLLAHRQGAHLRDALVRVWRASQDSPGDPRPLPDLSYIRHLLARHPSHAA